MATITTKIAKNGTTLYYKNGKRISRADAEQFLYMQEIMKKHEAALATMTEIDAIDEYVVTADAQQIAIDAEQAAAANAETDDSDDDDDDNVFDLLPALDELNDVDAGTGNIVTAEIHYSYIDGNTIRTGKAEKSFSRGKDAMHWLNQFNNSNLNYTIDEGTCFRFTNGRVYTVNPADFAEKMSPSSDGQSAARFTVKTDGKRNSYYIDGKRTARDKALDACAQMRGDNHFTIGFQTSRYGEGGSLIHSTEHKTMGRIDLKIGVHDDGYSVYFYNGFATAHLFKEYEDAKNCFNQIEQAFFAGKAGVKVNANGQVLVYHAPEIGGTDEIAPDVTPIIDDDDVANDDFAAKLAELKGQYIRAKCATEEARIDRNNAESAYNIACQKHQTARLAEFNAENAIDDFLDETAAQLDKQLLGADIFDADIQLITQTGTRLDNAGNILGGLKILATSGEQFAAIANGRQLATYDTPAQISTAINRLRDSIERGDPEFKFPTVDEIEKPPSESATVAAIAEACQQLNDNAPEGWEVYFDCEHKNFPVKFYDKAVITLDSLALQNILTPEKFFDRFRPLVDDSYTPRQQFLNELNLELDQLQQLRDELGDDSERLKTIDAMIEDVKQTLVQNEFAV